jgi:lipoprotein signal peptidase
MENEDTKLPPEKEPVETELDHNALTIAFNSGAAVGYSRGYSAGLSNAFSITIFVVTMILILTKGKQTT